MLTSMRAMIVTTNKQRDAWDEIASSSAHARLHQCQWWADPLERHGVHSEVVAVEEGGDIIGGALLRSVRLPLVHGAVTESLGGPLFPRTGPGYIETFLSQVVELARDWNSIAVSFADCSEPQVREDLESAARGAGLRTVRSPGTAEAVLRLTDADPDQIWTGYDQNVRRNIRKARKGGVHVREVTDPHELQTAHRAWMASAGRKNFSSIRPWPTLEPVVRTSLDRDVARVLASFSRDEMLGAIFVTFMGGVARYVYGGFFDGVDRLRPNHILHDEAIRIALEREMNSYSFGSVFDPDDPGRHGVDRFKLSFGATVELGVPTIVWERRPQMLHAFDRFKRLRVGVRVQEAALRRLRHRSNASSASS